MTLRGSGYELLTQIMDAASMRHRVIAQNVANVNTPGYKRLEVVFEDEMARALASHPPSSMSPLPAVKPQIVVGDGPERVDGNTVDIDREMNDMARNALLYEAAAQIVTSRIGQFRSAIAGR
jgi:flagellar basal-body rod protein FlgB